MRVDRDRQRSRRRGPAARRCWGAPRRRRRRSQTGTIRSSNSRASGGVRRRRSSTTRTGERQDMPGSRQVRLGLSARTVPRPTRIASLPGAEQMPMRAGVGPGDPDRRALALAAGRPSAPTASLSVTAGRPSVTRRTWPSATAAASSASTPSLDLDAGRDQPLDAAARRARVGIAERDHGARGPRGDDRHRRKRARVRPDGRKARA